MARQTYGTIGRKPWKAIRMRPKNKAGSPVGKGKTAPVVKAPPPPAKKGKK